VIPNRIVIAGPDDTGTGRRLAGCTIHANCSFDPFWYILPFPCSLLGLGSLDHIQTATQAGLGFKAGVKDYRLTYYTKDYRVDVTDLLAAFRVIDQPGVPPEEAGSDRS
jgi:hypothetical protein